MTNILIDADLLIYKIASGVEEAYRYPDGVWTYVADEKQAIKLLEAYIDRVYTGFGDDSNLLFCLSDTRNFRKVIYPEYKSNRIGTKKPLLLDFLREHVQATRDTVLMPWLEADDALGILSTTPGIEEDCVILTLDKDLLQVPANVAHLDTFEMDEPATRDCSRLFLKQVLTGDQVDGYPGCPGIGEKTADKLLDNPFVWEKRARTIKSGDREGEEEIRWVKSDKPVEDVWEAVRSHYEKAGLTNDDALKQARCAFILQYDYYDVAEEKIHLWGACYE